MTIREEWVYTFDTESWELIEDGKDKGMIKEANYIYVQWLEQKADDYRLMLKALVNGWYVQPYKDKWVWIRLGDGDAEYKVDLTQSNIPEINDELREEFKEI